MADKKVVSLSDRLDAERAEQAKSELQSRLMLTKGGTIKPCEHNVSEILKLDPGYDSLHFDEFLSSIRFNGRDWTDGDERQLLVDMQWQYLAPTLRSGHVHGAVLTVAWARRCDSLVDFVETLPKWDAVPRIEMAFCDAFGAEDSELTRAASRNLFIAMIARAVKPGAQVDTLWVIEGPQGSFKSRALRALGGELHAEITAPVGTTDFMRELRGVWLAELSELDSLRGREASTIKRLLSAPYDRFVEKYQSYPVRYQRRAVPIATTNECEYWQDSTGARRLIPIKAGSIRLDLIEQNRIQWFAEAKAAYRRGVSWWEFPELVEEAREERQQVDPWESTLEEAIHSGQARPDPAGMGTVLAKWPSGWISSAEILGDWLGLKPAQAGLSAGVRLGKVMRRLGFYPQRGQGRAQQRGWISVDKSDSKTLKLDF